MTRSNIIGIAICAIIFISAFLITGNGLAYLNLEAFMVVISGTFGAALLSYPFDHLKTSYFVAKGAYTNPGPDPDSVIGVLLDTAIRSRLDGLMNLEKTAETTTLHFLRDALSMLADNYPENEIRDILSSEIHFFRTRRMQQERVFRSMATYAPAFGLAGSVIGLIGLLTGLGDTGEVLRYIPIALISTLYGILFGNFILAPVAENIRGKTDREVLVQQLIIEGVSAIKTEANPHILEKRLISFLTPAARRDTHDTFAEMRKKYVKIAQQRRQAEEASTTGTASGASANAQTRR
ncbi:motility protein A [Desulfovibrio ferrophilus]|uniref:MotA/TolQ/ExbB proton channel n=1 Tax=Desulfovibrio ferrophilus TaxID=241368 RepID=A0A2Z6AUF1_9BACT|nr:MotA/TolQ/ExbB proton channel family protein [Desulfovibrio ferrophilus]BBD06858.1 MotA/TolQ/ExbB proton channel [Desulfovibrio ferrophilus]